MFFQRQQRYGVKFMGGSNKIYEKKKINLYFRDFKSTYYCGGSLIGKTFRFHRRSVGSTPTHRSTFGQHGYLTIEN